MKKVIKIILIILGVLLLIFAGMVGIAIVEEQKLDEIVADLINQEEVDMTIKMNGTYGTIEKMIKIDYKKIYELSNKIATEYNNPIIEKCLSAKNYQSDGPLFTNTRKEFEELKEARKKITDKMLVIVSDKEAKKRIKEYKLDEFDAEVYNRYVGQLRIYVNDLVDEDEKLNDVLDNVIAVLDFLGENKEKWKIEGENIIFDNQDLLDKYNWLTASSKLCTSCKEDVPSA